MNGVRIILAEAGLEPSDIRLVIHGTTLATNAIIERKGAKTALLTTEGFRDTIEIRHENRFEQYDVNIDLPPPLVPRRLRFPVRERIDARGRVLVKLNVDGGSLDEVIALLPALKSPTVSKLFGEDGFAVETVVAKSEINILIPALKDAGATDIIELPIAKIVH